MTAPATTSVPSAGFTARAVAASRPPAILFMAVPLLAATLMTTTLPTSLALAEPGASAAESISGAIEPGGDAAGAADIPRTHGSVARIVQAVQAARQAGGATIEQAATDRTATDQGTVDQAAIDQAARDASQAILATAARLERAFAAAEAATATAAEASNPSEPAETTEPGAAFLTCNLDLTVNGQVVATVNAETVRPWIVVGADGSAWIDDFALTSWVNGIEAVIDSVWATRSYQRPDGKWVTVYGGTYGWISNGAELDQIVRDAVYGGTVGSREVPMKQTAAVFNPGGQDWGNRYIDVDISEQYARMYDWDGSLIWESPCITGIPDGVHETPTGVYTITRMDTNQVLTGPYDPETDTYEYESFVQWWMPFIGNMVGLHDASWQPGFSSDAYLYRGSHGCVNLPIDNAYWLFCLIGVGDVVVTHY